MNQNISTTVENVYEEKCDLGERFNKKYPFLVQCPFK